MSNRELLSEEIISLLSRNGPNIPTDPTTRWRFLIEELANSIAYIQEATEELVKTHKIDPQEYEVVKIAMALEDLKQLPAKMYQRMSE